jgi:hypothetical protein
MAALGAALASLFLLAGSSSLYQVVVPAVVADDVSSAYWDLHDAGLTVAIDEPFSLDGFVTRQTPAPGREVRRGSVVSLELRAADFNGSLPTGGWLMMPSLIGVRLDLATRTLRALGALWNFAPLPPLRAGTGPNLLANYVVRAQHPRPGKGFAQTRWRIVKGDLITVTSTAGLEAALRGEE